MTLKVAESTPVHISARGQQKPVNSSTEIPVFRAQVASIYHQVRTDSFAVVHVGLGCVHAGRVDRKVLEEGVNGDTEKV